MIILCMLMFILLGEKVLLIADKINAVQEGDRLYASGDLISAEIQYRQAAGNSSIIYKDDEIAERLDQLSPITVIRKGLHTLLQSADTQSATNDFAGFMKSYESLLSLKATYMKPEGPYETYYRQLSDASGISDKFTSYFKQFKEQFLTELAQSQSGDGSSDDSFKWKLLQIPDVYYGSAASKEEQLISKFKSHDTARLKALAGAGNFTSMLDNSLSLINAYNNYNYKAPWVLEQTESSAKIILNKDLDGDNVSAYAGHAVAYRKFAESADFASSKVLSLINNRTTSLLNKAERLTRKGQYEEAIQLYGELTPLQDNAAKIAAAKLAWNIAEPVRLLPGGEVQGQYEHVISVKERYGTKVIVAGTDSSGVLHYALMNKDERVVSLIGDILPAFGSLRSLTFNEPLSVSSGGPVVLAQSELEGGRSTFTAYELMPEGISLLFSFTGDSYELQSDESIVVTNVDLGDGVNGQKALYRKADGVYQFIEIVQEYPIIAASELESHPFEKVSIHCEIVVDMYGNSLAYSDGRYILLQGEWSSITGNALVSGQYQNGYEFINSEFGEQHVPVFVVDSVGSLSFPPSGL